MDQGPIGVAFLDISAFIKLLRIEQGSEELQAKVADWTQLAANEFLAVEATCVAKRIGTKETVNKTKELLQSIQLINWNQTIHKITLTTTFQPPLRSLDAMHLATALHIRELLGVFVTYDQQLRAAAQTCGLETYPL